MNRRQPPEPPSFSAIQQGNFGIPAAASKWNPSNRLAARIPHARSSPLPAPREPAPRQRNRSMWSQALILFNVLGTPLSYSTTLEHHFTTLFPTHSLLSLALIPSLQLLFLFASPLPIGYIYRCILDSSSRPWGWRVLFGVGIILAIAAQFSLYVARSYAAVVVLQGPVLGTALGACFTISSLVLAGHYKNDVPLVSVQSGFAGFAGSVVYTALSRFSYQSSEDGNGARVHLYTGGVMAATLFTAFLLLARLDPRKEKEWMEGRTLHLSSYY
ncbi:hypothetical protein BKA58DRAFT_445597 [Alternaria rosae]|uniref:uncharacterized protein n=1 Tax=Alternaria rosae TaxID=1187941 RepID=UPI001E8DB5E3|nr:uncharacterized protein BKA58DRAFT_445597 [Alternaria rosae]KAH6881414.1 hypothetical protein BKA58DRAFT_445597 [Alternaria rosae]